MTRLRAWFARHAKITIDIRREEWWLLLSLTGAIAVALCSIIILRGLQDWLRIGVEAVVLYLILIAIYVLTFSTAEWFARAQSRMQELIYHELAERDAEIIRLNREAEAGAKAQAKLEDQARADEKTIKKQEGEIAKLKSESQMQWEIDRLNDVITNQQSHIAEMEGRLQRRTPGQGSAEYAIILAAIAAFLLLALTPIGAWLLHWFSQVGVPFS